jgi:tRNA nucleotidyltransferase (CCA-adding enzyme)
LIAKIRPILDEIIQNGGVPYAVGGCVRDFVLEKEIKDIDIEVHNISIEDLEKCLKKFGGVSLVGKKFGVLLIAHLDVDWSLPRKDSKGRKPKVEIDPQMTIKDACRRRDLTMNAMAIDLRDKDDGKVTTWKIVDPFNGLSDIKEKKLRLVDENLFLEDPLRFFRVMQFISRFEMTPDEKLNEVCKKMSFADAETGNELARERIFEEIKKLLLRSKRPSLGFRWLKDINRLDEIFPELGALVSTQQRKDYHPEGNVFEHTMQSLDASAVINEYESEEEKVKIMFGVLCHDMGKPKVTDKDLHARQHDVAGVAIAKTFLKRLTNNKDLMNSVCKIVRYHSMPGLLLRQKAGLKAYKRLAVKLSPEIDMSMLGIVAHADMCGRNPNGSEPLGKGFFAEENIDEFKSKIIEAAIEHAPEKPILLGKHLLDEVKSGPELGRLVKKAYEIQIEENIKDVEELKRRVLKIKI